MNRSLTVMGKVVGLLLLALILFTAPGAWADGFTFIRRAYLAAPTEPLQEAVIVHDGSREQMILRVAVKAEDDRLAWVVPVPGRPEISQADPAVFSALELGSSPKVEKSRVGATAAVFFPALIFLIFAQAVWLSRPAGGAARAGRALAVALLSMFEFFSLALIGSGMLGMTQDPPLAAQANVIVHEFKTLGALETTTLSASDPAALTAWLREHDFRVPAAAEPVFKHYVDQGWFFVATRLAATSPEAATGPAVYQPPTLSLTFETREIVFPLKITSLQGQKSLIMLYVLAPDYVRAGRFQTLYAGERPKWDLSKYLPADSSLNLAAADHFTRLAATLRPGQMEDVTLKPDRSLGPQRLTAYTRELREHTRLALMVSLAAGLLMLMFKGRRALKAAGAGMLLISLGLCSSPRSLVSSSPLVYREGRASSLARRNLQELARAEQAYFQEHRAYAASFQELGWRPQAEDGYFYYLSKTEYWPKGASNRYAVLFEEAADLRALGDFAPAADRFTAVAIGSLHPDQPPEVMTVAENGEVESLSVGSQLWVASR